MTAFQAIVYFLAAKRASLDQTAKPASAYGLGEDATQRNMRNISFGIHHIVLL